MPQPDAKITDASDADSKNVFIVSSLFLLKLRFCVVWTTILLSENVCRDSVKSIRLWHGKKIRGEIFEEIAWQSVC